MLAFDASASADPDAEDSIASFAWTFRALSGQTCEVPVVAGTGPVADVRFGCPGRYAVDVVATDEMGATATLTKELEVTAHVPSLLVVGADVPLDHLCTSATRCTAGPASLSASTPGIDQVSFSWTVEPPADRPLSSSRRVTFSPGATVASPEVSFETDGDAISGDWLFKVEARDAAGVIGVAQMRVSVGNNPPVLTKTLFVPEHGFDGTRFTAVGEIPYAITDPDGDALVGPTLATHHTGDGSSSTFDAGFVEGQPRVTFSIEVPYTSPADASYLIGGLGLERSIVFSVSDVNGGRANETWPIVVGNRPPVLQSAPAPFAVDHTYDAIALEYVADVPLSTWSDPDGDPLWQLPGSSTGEPLCPEVVVLDGVAHAQCRMQFTGTLAVADFAHGYEITQAVQDPWTPAASTSTVSFTVKNRPPAITSTAAVSPAGCAGSGACCAHDPETGACDVYTSSADGTISVPSRWVDPDGDPISVSALATGNYTPLQPLVCTPAECVLELSITPFTFCRETPLTAMPTTISDGLGSVSGTLPIQSICN